MGQGRIKYSLVVVMLIMSLSFAEVISGDGGTAFVNQTATVPGAGNTFYKPDGKIVKCPVVAPGQMGAECLAMMGPNYCPTKAECGATPVPQIFPGQNDTAEQTGNTSYYIIPDQAVNTTNQTNSTIPVKPPVVKKTENTTQIKENILEAPVSKGNVDSPMNYLVYVVLALGIGAVIVLFMLFKRSISEEEA
ncbi:hypothetical protein HZC07_00135 [Candidatus Micrarchaeota archaeon]|nr:hypothetical protein [Candidatus Micrarchaeota archaeon]